MTFSIAGVCGRSGELGYAVATSSVCVGARVGMAAPGLCVIFSQCRTDQLLHRVGLEAYRETRDTDQAHQAMKDATIQSHWRQLGVFGADGKSSFFSGGSCLDVAGGVTGRDCLALGNAVANDKVLGAMVSGFETADGPLAARLIAGLKHGELAGAEIDPVQSSALQVYGRYEFPVADLRVDKDPAAIEALLALWQDWAPKAESYILRAIDPDSAKPSNEIENFAP